MTEIEDDSDNAVGSIEVAHRSTSATKTIIRSVLDLMMRNNLLTRDKRTEQFDHDLKELIREIEVVIRTNMLNHGNEVAEKVRREMAAGVRNTDEGARPSQADGQASESGNRSKFLLRLIAGRFSHLFADPENPVFPREVVMGFDNYMVKLLGEVLYGELNVEAQELLSHFQTDDDGEIWREITKNDRHKRFAYNILIRILLKFEDFEWARRNFVSILNNVTERKSGFMFDDAHFQLLFTALFSDLFYALSDDQESLKLDFMFGEGTTERINAIHHQFKAYKEQVAARQQAQKAS